MKLDFFTVKHRITPKRTGTIIDVYPEFLIKDSNELMVRGGGKFYAVLNKDTGFWETNEIRIQQYVDEELKTYAETNPEIQSYKQELGRYCTINVMYMLNSRSRSWVEYKMYISNLPDHYSQLDDKLCFDTDKVNPEDHFSKKLPYKLERGPHDAWDELAGTLYEPKELEKIEWSIGSIIAGDSREIQKFVVLYGEPGAGKGTILKIIQKLFPGYYEVFDAKSLGNSSNAFAFEQFRSNPLIALQMDGDLSKIEDNSKLNSLISHETVLMNEKRKQSYSFTPRCFLFMASNKEVKMTDANSGLLRRLIDVNPSGRKLPKKEYDRLVSQIGFQLSGIAHHCLDVYRKLGKNYYNGYEPTQMMLLTNPVYNFMKDSYEDPERPFEIDPVQVQDLYYYWTQYCEKVGIMNHFAKYQFISEVKPYYNDFKDRGRNSDGKQVRSLLSGLKVNRLYNGSYGRKDSTAEEKTLSLVLDKTVSLLDDVLKDCQAQYGVLKPEGGSKPKVGWDSCKTTLKDIDTSKLHFVRIPLNHIVIDFDIKNEKGEKDAMLNLEAADKWPKTYAEYSQGGKGIHLHYIYDGDPMKLEGTYSDNIEIKVYSGKTSLRRRLSLCNDIPIARLNDGALPKKEVKTDGMIDFESVKNEQHMRNIVGKCLRKDIAQPYTATAMSLIKKTLDDAWDAGIHYDIRDMRPAIRSFAAKSSHQKDTCMKIEASLHYCDAETEKTTPNTKERRDIPMSAGEQEERLAQAIRNSAQKPAARIETKKTPIDETLVFFDIEVFPNLLLVNWKEAGEGKGVVRMINPTRAEIGELLNKKLVGFNCRRYDNHILYARYIGYDNAAIYRLSQRIVSGSQNAMFGNAYDISFTDVYDFAAKKQSLKKWEIELGIHHQELGLPWDKPVPEERWAEVAAYCDNDVIATEAVFNKLAGDFKARQILAEIAGMTVNDTTNQLTTSIIFGDDPKPQVQFNYPDLTKKFPGYSFRNGKSYFKHRIQIKGNWKDHVIIVGEDDDDKRVFFIDGVSYANSQVIAFNSDVGWIDVEEIIGEGGRVFARQGIFRNVTTYDVASMHPSSIIAENGFGKYTDGFRQLLEIRIAIKHRDFESAKKMLNGRLAKYLDDPEMADALSQALKIAINSVYGLTAAGFDNKFRDPRNKDNWVAKRGALFIETLREKVMEMGATVVHIKTDSIKVEKPTKEISDFILAYGKQWGYTFEIEDIYEKMCLVNDAVYIALRDKEDPGWLKECRKAKLKAEETGKPYVEPTRWSATGAQFAHPYVFKTLFSHEDVQFRDLCETKTVTSALYLDMNENLSDVTAYEKDLEKLRKRAKDLLKVEGYSGTWEEWPSWRKDNPDAQDQHEGMIYAELDDLVKDEDVLKELIASGHNYVFVGKAGSFCPVKAGCGGGILVREKDGKFSAATGSKGYRWREGESLVNADRLDMIDFGYFEALNDTARKAISEYGDFEKFASEEPTLNLTLSSEDISAIAEQAAKQKGEPDTPPWLPPCGDGKYDNCYDCPFFDLEKIPPECKKHYDLTDYFTVIGTTFTTNDSPDNEA